MVRAGGCACARMGTGGCADARPVGSSKSIGNAPLAWRSGSEASRGGMEAGIDAVAVAEETVAEDCDAPNCIVVDDRVFGDAVCDVANPACARIALSPLVGPVPLYGSAKTVYP